ncbi:hypothetical protein D9M71_789740 [compost metagenome]
MCIFGQHLDGTDRHLLEAIKLARPAHLAIAIRPLSDASIISQKQHYVQRFADMPDLPLYFFDAYSHPLGTPGLEIPVPVPIRKRR